MGGDTVMVKGSSTLELGYSERLEIVSNVDIAGCIRTVYNGNNMDETIYHQDSCVGR